MFSEKFSNRFSNNKRDFGREYLSKRKIYKLNRNIDLIYN